MITAGTEVGKALDLGLQFSWYHRGSEGEQFVGSYVGPGGNVIQQSIQTQSVNTDLLPLMGIVRLKFPITTVLQPYVGGGAGFEWLFIEGVDGAGYQFSNDYGGFGAQAMAGVNLARKPHGRSLRRGRLQLDHRRGRLLRSLLRRRGPRIAQLRRAGPTTGVSDSGSSCLPNVCALVSRRAGPARVGP